MELFSELREPMEKDLENRIKTIILNLTVFLFPTRQELHLFLTMSGVI